MCLILRVGMLLSSSFFVCVCVCVLKGKRTTALVGPPILRQTQLSDNLICFTPCFARHHVTHQSVHKTIWFVGTVCNPDENKLKPNTSQIKSSTSVGNPGCQLPSNWWFGLVIWRRRGWVASHVPSRGSNANPLEVT